MDQAQWQKWFEEIWADREERLYRRFFGDTGPGIYPIPVETFNSIGTPDPDPRFLFHGVFECPPTAERGHWIYVTSGMSNAWGESPETVKPEEFSGLGFEFVIHTQQQARWPIFALHWLMAVQLMTAAGKLKGELLQRNDRIPLGGALARKDGLITNLLVISPEERGFSTAALPDDPTYPGEFSLASGRVEFLLTMGITAKEAEFAHRQGAEGLIALLRHQQVFPFTDPARQSVV